MSIAKKERIFSLILKSLPLELEKENKGIKNRCLELLFHLTLLISIDYPRKEIENR